MAWIQAVWLNACLCCISSTQVGYDFLFHSNPKAPCVRLSSFQPGGVVNLGSAERTYCLYVHPENTNGSEATAVFEHVANSTENFAIALLDISVPENVTIFYAGDAPAAEVNGIPKLDDWTHLCISWSQSQKIIQFYFNGVEISKVENFSNQMPLEGVHELSFGQYSDDASTGFQGRMTQFNYFNRTLNTDEVKKVQSGELYGDVVDWRNSVWEFNVDVDIVNSTAPNKQYAAAKSEKSANPNKAKRKNKESTNTEASS